jgi:S-adenosyl-L-methionine hydrolase (adenosine-forming)
MAIITLLTDWGLKDHYTAMAKGKILSVIPDAMIIDISHQAKAYNLNSAAFILRNSYHHFPEGTFHIVDIFADATIEMPHIAIAYNNHFFIGADNGLFSLVFDEQPDQIIEIDMIQDTDTYTFATFDIFIKVVKNIIENGKLTDVGHVRDRLINKISLHPVTSENLIKGHVVYIDHYENVITNITQSMFASIGKKRPFRLYFGASRYSINKISQSYKDVPPGEILAFFNSTGHLEIAVSVANAAGLLGLKIDDTVRIEFR